MIGGGGLWPTRERDLAIVDDVLGRLRPFVLHDDQDAEAELGHDLGRFRADRRGVEALLGMRDRARPDRGARDLVELALPLEFGLAQRLADQLRGFGEARPRLAHRDAEALVFDARRAPAKAEQAAPAAQDVEQRDLLGDADRVVPRQHDDRGAERDPLGAAGEIGQQLQRRRRHRIAGEMMLEREQRVEAERLGEVAHRQMIGDDRHVGARPGSDSMLSAMPTFMVALLAAITGFDSLATRVDAAGCGCPGTLLRRV